MDAQMHGQHQNHRSGQYRLYIIAKLSQMIDCCLIVDGQIPCTTKVGLAGKGICFPMRADQRWRLDAFAVSEGKVTVVMGCAASHDYSPLASAVAGLNQEAATAMAAIELGFL
jgi:hypothetical protein